MSKVSELAIIIKNRNFSEREIESQIRWIWEEATKLVKNINDTSIGEADRIRRITEFEETYGLSKTHII